jgi:hypothetical protein
MLFGNIGEHHERSVCPLFRLESVKFKGMLCVVLEENAYTYL